MGVHAQAERGVDLDEVAVGERPAAGADEKAALVEKVEVAPHRIARDVEGVHELGHARLAAFLQQRQQAAVAQGGQGGAGLLGGRLPGIVVFHRLL